MKQIVIKQDTIIKAKGFDISIGRTIHHIALMSHSTGKFTPLSAIRKGGRLAKVKRAFKSKFVSSTHFFLEGMSESETLKLIDILK